MDQKSVGWSNRKPADVNNGLNHGISRVITMVTNYGYYWIMEQLIWLVVYLPLSKMMEFVSWDDEILSIWKVINNLWNHQPETISHHLNAGFRFVMGVPPNHCHPFNVRIFPMVTSCHLRSAGSWNTAPTNAMDPAASRLPKAVPQKRRRLRCNEA